MFGPFSPQPKYHAAELGAKRPREETPPSSEDEKGPEIEEEKPDIDRLLDEAEPVEVMDLPQVMDFFILRVLGWYWF
jgi:hypothetical protein